MSTSESEVLLTLKRKKSEESKTPDRGRKREDISHDLLNLCDATARITKMLLGLGAENNWEDVQACKGRSLEAGKYRSNWLYLSRSDHSSYEDSPNNGEKKDWFEAFEEGIPQTFFYHTPKTEYKTHRAYVERNAAAAVLSLTGSCDQHAYVLATLLRAILPEGTEINICGLRMAGTPFPHTFVVVGALGARNRIPLNELPLQSLLVVDAWPTIGGAVALKDFFVCCDAIDQGILDVDKRYVADGTDHLIKRVRKQKILLDIIKTEDSDITAKPAARLPSFTLTTLEEQANYTKMIKRDPYLSGSPSDYEGMFGAPTISQQYSQPMRSQEAFQYICAKYPHKDFNRCLEYVHEQVKKIIAEDENPADGFSRRLNSAF